MYEKTQVTNAIAVNNNRLTTTLILLLSDVLQTVTAGVRTTIGKSIASNMVWTFKTKVTTKLYPLLIWV